MLCFIAFAISQLHAVDRYVGFNMQNHPAFSPNVAYLIKETLRPMRINGLYGTKEMCPYPDWRHPIFMHATNMDMELENNLSYPCDPIAALLQWCYPSPARIVFEHNVGDSDILGVIENMPDQDDRNRLFGVILKTTADLMSLTLDDQVPDFIQKNWEAHFPVGEIPYSNTFLDILFQAVRLSCDASCPIYYKARNDKNIVPAILMTYMTDVLTKREDVIAALQSAGLLCDQELFEEQICNKYINQSKCLLPDFLSEKRVSVTLLDGEKYDFIDCGESAFLNFCLSFLWHEGTVQVDRWEHLKAAYPGFAPFIVFFEKYKTLQDIEKHRNEWAQLMCEQKSDSIIVQYNLSQRAGLMVGHDNFLNLMAILFKEDSVLQKVCTVDDEESSIFDRFTRLIEILNNGQANFFLSREKSIFNQNFCIETQNGEDLFQLYLMPSYCIVYYRPDQDSDNVLNLEYIWNEMTIRHNERNNTLPLQIDRIIHLRSLVTQFWGNWGGEDDLSVCIEQLVKGFFVEENSNGQTKITLCETPLGRSIFFGYLVQNHFPVLIDENYSWCQLLKQMQSELSKEFFDQIYQSHISTKWHILAYYNQVHYFQELKKSTEHPDYAAIFGGDIQFSQKHSLFTAFKGNAMDVINCITDNGEKDFWKIHPENTHIDNRILFYTGISENLSTFEWLMQHQKSYFDLRAFCDVRNVLPFFTYPDIFNKMLVYFYSLDESYKEASWIGSEFIDHENKRVIIPHLLIELYLMRQQSYATQAAQFLNDVFPNLRFTEGALNALIAKIRLNPERQFWEEEQKLHWLRTRFIDGYVAPSATAESVDREAEEN